LELFPLLLITTSFMGDYVRLRCWTESQPPYRESLCILSLMMQTS